MARMGSPFALVAILLVSSLIVNDTGGLRTDTARSQGPTYVHEDSQIIRIGNDALEMVINKSTGGGLDDIIDHSTGTSFFGDPDIPAFMFLIYFFNGTGVEGALQWDGYTISFSNSTDSDRSYVNISYLNLKGYSINVTVSIEIGSASEMVQMRMSIRNDEDFALRDIYFPFVAGLTEIGPDGSDDEFFYPGGDGAVFKDPFLDLHNFSFSDMYPSSLSMQVMSYYDPDIAGLYVASHDTSGHPKEIGFGPIEWGGTDHFSFSYNHLIPDFSGNDFDMDYYMNIGVFHGDWMDTAEIYRDWVETTPFVSGGKIGADKEIPPWFLNTSIVQVVRGNDPDIEERSYPEILHIVDEHAEVTGASTTALIMGWGGNGAWVGPNYFPPAGGKESFVENISALKENGNHALVYISGTVWRVTRDDIGYSNHSYFDTEGLPWVATDRNGDPIFDYIYETIGWHSARMDPMTQFWQDMVVNNALELAKLGIDGIQIDEFPLGSIYPCYNVSHGHPPGYSEEIVEAYITILDRIREEGREINPDLIMSMEEPCEIYVPYMDTYVSRDDAPEFMLYPGVVTKFGDRVEFVPFFTWVFHEYITVFGEHLPMDKGYASGFRDQSARAIARTLVTGEIINMAGETRDNRSSDLFDLYNRSATASTGYANRYVIGGTPVRPLDLDVPTIDVIWYDWAAGTGGPPVSEPAVMHSTWSGGNDTGIVLVNWGVDTWEEDIDIPLWLIPDNESSMRVIKNGIITDVIRSMESQRNVSISLDRNEVALIEILKLPDLKTIDVSLPDRDILTNDSFECVVNVRNEGTLPSPIYIEAYLDDEWMRSADSFNEVLPGGEADIQLTILTDGKIGNYTLSIIADPTNDREELFEDNNRLQIDIEILERPRSDLVITIIDEETSDPVWNATVSIDGGPAKGKYNHTDNLTNRFSFPSIIAGRYDIRINSSSYHIYQGEIVLMEGGTNHSTISLIWDPESHSLAGSINDNETGEVISHLDIRIFDQSSDMIWVSSTDENGTYSQQVSGPGPFRIEIIDPRFEPRASIITINRSATMTRMDIHLDPIHLFDISGSVRDNVTDIPVSNATMESMDSSMKFITKADGSFLIDQIQAGTYHFTISAPGYVGKNITVDLSKDLQITIALDPTPPPPDKGPGIISGIVTNRCGTPLSGVSILDPEGDLLTTTDDSGSFLIEFEGEGNYTLIFNLSGYEEKQSVSYHVMRGDFLNITVKLQDIPDPEPIREENGEENGFPMIILIMILLMVPIIIALIFFVLKDKDGMIEE